MDYVLAAEFSPNELAKTVERYFEANFKLYGNPFAVVETSLHPLQEDRMVFCQALIRERK